ncbi:MAG: tetratricopeptide repeat protein [Chloroflexi bacterium]|nr:tetratricopeptide repeat protein [Chloroflexota bacterium]MBP7043047.1 tetratricopeptide repeat protein [Chloroflexota bacterium]
MKKTLTTMLIFLSLALILGLLAGRSLLAQTADMSVANSLAANGRYAEAAQAYQQLIDQGAADSAVYYNLGNAYMRLGNVGQAIVNYQRAARLDPRDPDIQANLAAARAQAIDQFPAETGSPLDNFAVAASRVASINEMALLALGLWFGFGLLWFIYRQSQHGRKRDMLQFGVSLAGLLVVLAVSALGSRLVVENGRQSGVIVADTVSVSAEPSANMNTDFDLHNGAEVTISQQRGSWVQVSLPGGQVNGWVPVEAIEPIIYPAS